MRIEACTDSHVHWAATGAFAERLSLNGLRAASQILDLPLPAAHAGWILGYGWDESNWDQPPTRALLDQWCPHQPVAFSRVDGHALWVNSAALRAAELVADLTAEQSDILVDLRAAPVFDAIPPPSRMDLRRHLLRGAKIFNDAGYTHIRDMAVEAAQFEEAVRLDEAGLLTLAVESYFWAKNPEVLDATLDVALRARSQCTPNLRLGGLKIFLDGTLGSRSAALSRPYAGDRRASESRGELFWSADALGHACEIAWANKFGLAVHAIGDAASEMVARVALDLRVKNVRGRLHIEHGQLMRPETIFQMKTLGAVVHLQPAHVLADSPWLKDRIGDLFDYAFPWRRLQEAGVDFDFGSDSPIDPPSVARVHEGVGRAAELGIPRLLGSAARYLVHPDRGWAPNSFTQFDSEWRPEKVIFRGNALV